jgi:hypothetical protein
MRAINTCQRIKGPSLNHKHEHAERILTLSDIDSLYINGDISHNEACVMAIALTKKTRGAEYTALLNAVASAARKQ